MPRGIFGCERQCVHLGSTLAGVPVESSNRPCGGLATVCAGDTNAHMSTEHFVGDACCCPWANPAVMVLCALSQPLQRLRRLCARPAAALCVAAASKIVVEASVLVMLEANDCQSPDRFVEE